MAAQLYFYKIVTALTSDGLEQAVNVLLNEGWVLAGNLCIDSAGYCQPMMKAR